MRKYRSDKNKDKDKRFVSTEEDIQLYKKDRGKFNSLHSEHKRFKE